MAATARTPRPPGPAESSPMRRGLKAPSSTARRPARPTRRIFPDEEGTESYKSGLEAAYHRRPQNLPR